MKISQNLITILTSTYLNIVVYDDVDRPDGLRTELGQPDFKLLKHLQLLNLKILPQQILLFQIQAENFQELV